MKTTIARRIEPLPLGVSQKWIDEHPPKSQAEEGDDSAAIIRSSPAYIKLLRHIAALDAQIIELQLRNHQLSKALEQAGTRRKPSTSKQQPSEMIVDGVTYVNVAWIVKKTGLDQSVVSRQMKGIKALPGMAAKWIPKSQAENISRQPRGKKRAT